MKFNAIDNNNNYETNKQNEFKAKGKLFDKTTNTFVLKVI